MHSKAEDAAHEKKLLEALADPTVDLVAVEKDKIKGAVRTDFILSAEIIAITLGTVQDSAFLTQISVLSGIAILMTVGVYGLVAGIVKLDDGGLHLSKKTGALRALGVGILATAPWLMKGLSVAGTAAMFLVGGGILTHGIPALDHAIEALSAAAGTVLGAITPLLADAVVGIAAGALVLAAVTLVRRLLPKRSAPAA